MTRIWYTSYFLSTLFTFSDPLQVLKSSTNELTSWIGCVRWGRQCWAPPGQFWKPFQRQFLNVTHIKYITCMHSFKAAFIAFLVTSLLNWPWNCMLVVYFALWYERIQATARAGAFVRAIEDHALRAQDCFRARLTSAWRWSEGKCVSETSSVWCSRKDVLRLNKCTSCQEKKWQKQQLWVRRPILGLAPASIALNIFTALNWKNESPAFKSS